MPEAMERIEAERPEVALTRSGVRTGFGRWHAVNPDDPWFSACGRVIENNSAKRADNADFSCQHRACQRILTAANTHRSEAK